MSVAYPQQATTAWQQLGLAIAEKQLDQAAQQAAAAADPCAGLSPFVPAF